MFNRKYHHRVRRYPDQIRISGPVVKEIALRLVRRKHCFVRKTSDQDISLSVCNLHVYSEAFCFLIHVLRNAGI